MSAAAPHRLARSGVFAAVCAGVSACGHAVVSDTTIPAAGMVVGFVLVLAMAWAAASRERGYRTILAWMLWGQLTLHLAFHTSQTWSGTSPSPAAHAMGGHHPASTAQPSASVELGAGDSSVAMVAIHLAAALISAWWLRRGEAALVALTRALRGLVETRLLFRSQPPRGIAAPLVVRPAPVDHPPLHDTLLPSVRMLRGPPALRTQIP